MKGLFAVFVLAAAACGPTSERLPAGTVQLRFSAADSVRRSSQLTSPLVGTVYGALFLAEDVGVTGPRSGAEQVSSVEVADVDLRTSTTSDTGWTSEALRVGDYVFLGFMDVNGNGAGERNPDAGDPVTQALANKFTIQDNAEAKRIVLFELVFN